MIGWLWPVWRWADHRWWRYLLAECDGWTMFWCRVRGHPAGEWFYTSNPEATEPDHRCRNCGENLG